MAQPKNSEKASSASGLVEFEPGAVIIRQGDPGEDMFIIEQGKVEILQDSPSGQRPLGVLEAGDFFGEMAILDDQPRGASAKAQTACRLLRIDRSTFDQMLREYPEVAVRMLRKLTTRLRLATASAAAPPSEIAPAPAPAPSAPPPAAAEASSETHRRAALPVHAVLVVGTGATKFSLPDQDDIKIGRLDSVTGIAPEIDLTSVDSNKLTSRRHARIVRKEGVYSISEEIGTPNGTFVNGRRLKTGVPIELHPGDRVHFADIETTFRME
jgi:CRP-like cAMP-binding protein